MAEACKFCGTEPNGTDPTMCQSKSEALACPWISRADAKALRSAGLVEGDVFRAPYPFIRDIYREDDEDGPVETLVWRPGVEFRLIADESYAVAHGVGQVILTVVSLHKPGRFPERVFFTRRWQPPDGREFGKGALRIATKQSFATMATGYRFPFDVMPYEPSPTPSLALPASAIEGGTEP